MDREIATPTEMTHGWIHSLNDDFRPFIRRISEWKRWLVMELTFECTTFYYCEAWRFSSVALWPGSELMSNNIVRISWSHKWEGWCTQEYWKRASIFLLKASVFFFCFFFKMEILRFMLICGSCVPWFGYNSATGHNKINGEWKGHSWVNF